MMEKSKMEINSDGTKIWTNSQGLWHNEEGPAQTFASGEEFYLINDNLHRENGPAVIVKNVIKFCIEGWEIL